MFPLAAIPWRLIGYGAGVATILLLGWRVHAWREAYKELPGVQQALEREEACADESKCSERQKALESAQAAIAKQVVYSYEQELSDLRGRPVPTRVIRVCRAANPGDVRDAGPAQGTDAARPGTGLVHGEIEFNTRPLRELAREADEVSARLRALQGFNEALSKPGD